MDPVNPNIVYAGTGEYNPNPDPTSGCGVLKSVDGGSSWALTQQAPFAKTGGGYMAFSRILVDPGSAGSTTSSVVYATGELEYSDPQILAQVGLKVLSGSTSSLVVHPTKPTTLFAGVVDPTSTTRQRGVYRSTDNGVTWAPLPPFPVLANAGILRIEMANSPAAPDKLYVLVGNTANKLAGLFAWDDAKGTWTPLATNGVFTPNPRGTFGDQTGYDLVIAGDPRNANRLYIAGTRGYRSDDGGASFVMMGEENHSDWHVIVTAPSNPDVIYAGTDGGISVSTDIGASWTSRSSGLSIAQFYGGISATRDGSKIMGGSQDNGTFIYNGSRHLEFHQWRRWSLQRYQLQHPLDYLLGDTSRRHFQERWYQPPGEVH